jgi:DNA-binding response OmpR family regulator
MSNTILLVEDDEIISTIISNKLEKRNHVVIKVYKGDEVKKNIIRHSPCAIILDFDLPNMNGDEVFKEIRSFYKGIVVFLTSKDSENIELDCLRLGADDYMRKNKSFDVFYNRLMRLINNKHRLMRLLNNEQEKSSSALLTQNKVQPQHKAIEITEDELDLITSLFAS